MYYFCSTSPLFLVFVGLQHKIAIKYIPVCVWWVFQETKSGYFAKYSANISGLILLINLLNKLLSFYVSDMFTWVCVPVARPSPGWSTQRRRRPHGELCSGSSRLSTRLMPAANTTAFSLCWRNTAATSRTTSRSWRTSPASCSVSFILMEPD